MLDRCVGPRASPSIVIYLFISAVLSVRPTAVCFVISAPFYFPPLFL
jgi:hypothetical protein